MSARVMLTKRPFLSEHDVEREEGHPCGFHHRHHDCGGVQYRSSQILKRNSHITIKVKERDTEEATDSEVETKEAEVVQKTEQEQE